MRRVILLSAGLFVSGVAFAEDAPAPETEPPAAEEPAPVCDELEGEAKDKCEAEAAPPAEAPPEKKGGKASRDSKGNLELEVDDE